MNKTIVSGRSFRERELPSRWGPSETDDCLITTVHLLAAGSGTRLKPLTDDCPKCLTELHGIPILRRLISCLVEEGFSRLVVVVGYRDAQIRDYLERHASGLELDFVDCREYATTNNNYSLWRAREHIQEPFVLIESDLVFDSHLLGMMRVWDRIAVARFRAPLLGTTVSINEFGRVLSFRVGADACATALGHKTVNVYSLSKATWLEPGRSRCSGFAAQTHSMLWAGCGRPVSGINDSDTASERFRAIIRSPTAPSKHTGTFWPMRGLRS